MTRIGIQELLPSVSLHKSEKLIEILSYLKIFLFISFMYLNPIIARWWGNI